MRYRLDTAQQRPAVPSAGTVDPLVRRANATSAPRLRSSHAPSSRVGRLNRWGGGRLVRSVQFGLVGLAGLAVNQAILAALVSLAHMNYLIAATLSSQGSTIASFIINESWVFKKARVDPGARALGTRFLVFDALNTASLALRLPVLYGLTSGLGVNYLVSNFVAVALFMLLRFVVADSWIWRQRVQPSPTIPTGV